MGVRALPGPRKRRRAYHPIHWKIRYETIFNEKNVFVKSQGIYLESSWFEIQNVSNSEKKQKINFGYVQIGSRFNYNMKIFFVARNNIRNKFDSHLCLESS